jgi:hypothetical protein
MVGGLSEDSKPPRHQTQTATLRLPSRSNNPLSRREEHEPLTAKDAKKQEKLKDAKESKKGALLDFRAEDSRLSFYRRQASILPFTLKHGRRML